MIQITVDDPSREDVQGLSDEHLADMYVASPAGRVHALDHAALADLGITFWTARRAGMLLGCGALKKLTSAAAELKSMRTTASSRGQGVATRLLAVLIEEASQRGYSACIWKPALRPGDCTTNTVSPNANHSPTTVQTTTASS